jgi:exopolysaccharide biosynthesis polyprenyl glycosylphosphotransferase
MASVESPPLTYRIPPPRHPVREELEEALATRRARARDATYRRGLAVADVLSAALAVFVAITVIGDDALRPASFAALPLVVLVNKLAGLYDRDEPLLQKNTLDELPRLFEVATLYALLFWVLSVAFVDGHVGRGQLLGIWGLLFIGLALARAVSRRVARAATPEERCLVLGEHDRAERLRDKLDLSPTINAKVVGWIPLRHGRLRGQTAPNLAQSDGLPVLGELRNLGSALARWDIERVIIAADVGDPEHVLDVIRLAKSFGVKTSVLPRLFEVVGSSATYDDVDGVTLLGIRRFGLSRSSQFVKRSFDLVGSGLLLLIFSPLLVLMAAAIKLDSRGSVLFRQRRIGRDDREFVMLKFRTMQMRAERIKKELEPLNEADGLFKIHNDPRITRVGRLLRHTSLDELPQLINVLRGEMSLVGPRPLVPDEDRRITGWHRRRLHVMPGVTGHWQILGPTRVPLDEMVKIDYLYGANWSLWGDVKILLRTALFVAGRHGL